MTIYVDDVRLPYGRMIMCHMWADDEAELHAFASRLGLQRRWFQEPPKASWKHYDISLGVKKEALAAGAVLTDKYGPAEHEARRTGDKAKLVTIEAARRLRQK
jgi:hypothetical protein